MNAWLKAVIGGGLLVGSFALGYFTRECPDAELIKNRARYATQQEIVKMLKIEASAIPTSSLELNQRQRLENLVLRDGLETSAMILAGNRPLAEYSAHDNSNKYRRLASEIR